jgi:hypothetical protein
LKSSSLPSGLARDRAGHAGRERPVTRNDDTAGPARMLEHIMVAAVTLDPALAFESRRNFCPVRFGLGHGTRSEYANIGAFLNVNQPV